MHTTSAAAGVGGRAALSLLTARAFTLIEVTLALGIMSFVMMSIMALVPIGLDSFRKAANATIQSHITQSIVTQLQTARFSSLSATTYRYDVDGKIVASSDPAGVFTATVSYPAPTNNSVLSPLNAASFKAALIQIAVNNQSPPAASFPVVIADRGQ